MKCEICKKEFKNLNGLSAHITKTHKNISQQSYYDTYIKPQDYRNICPTCGKPTEFISVGYGYKTHCSRECSNKDLSIIKQRHETINELYGGHALCFQSTQEKCRQSILDRYGASNAFQINSIKEKAHSKTAMTKRYYTMKMNNTFKTSKQEDQCYDMLSTQFSDIRRNYKSKLYPFRCDFYIPDLDLYIECNFHWTHGRHWFNATNENDQKMVHDWMSKSKYFQNAANTWTNRDVQKRQIAKHNNLNYVVLWSMQDFKDWIDHGCQIRHDF